jgi:hypothetical protein
VYAAKVLILESKFLTLIAVQIELSNQMFKEYEQLLTGHQSAFMLALDACAREKFSALSKHTVGFLPTVFYKN